MGEYLEIARLKNNNIRCGLRRCSAPIAELGTFGPEELNALGKTGYVGDAALKLAFLLHQTGKGGTAGTFGGLRDHRAHNGESFTFTSDPLSPDAEKNFLALLNPKLQKAQGKALRQDFPRGALETLPIVYLFPGFAPCDDGVWRLTDRVCEQWRRAKQNGISWKHFCPAGRRYANGAVPHFVPTLNTPRRRFIYPAESFRFLCPVCGALNLASISEVACDTAADN